jgi:hypothetical protein
LPVNASELNAKDTIQDSFKVLVQAKDGRKAIVTIRIVYDFREWEGSIQQKGPPISRPASSE